MDIAYVRLLNASAGRDISVHVNGGPLFKGLGYKDFTEYSPVREGTYHFQVFKDGIEILNRMIEFIKDMIYTVVIMGEKDDYLLELVFDELSPLREDKALVRFINAVPDETSFNILINNKKKLLDLEYGEVGDFLELEPGDYILEATDSFSGEKKYCNQKAVLNAGKRYAGYILPV